MKIFVKGILTHLTYQVEIYEYFGSWRCEVRRPVLKPARLWGLIPARIKYEKPFDCGRNAEVWAHQLTPSEIARLGQLAVKYYESWKLAWEAPHELKEAK